MKVKIKKGGKTKTYNVVESWEEVTLEKFMQLNMGEIDTQSKEALEVIATLSDLPKNIIKQLSLRDVTNLFERLGKIEIQDVLKCTVVIDSVEYGMHPDLSEITLGEYADLETFMVGDLKNNLPEIMAILFRPIKEKDGDVYTIEAYDGNIKIRAEKMKKMSAEQVQQVLVFFWTFVRIFIMILPLSLVEGQKLKTMEKFLKPSQKSGVGLA